MVRLICGLGNPGLRYEHTRHNLGYDILDRLARRLDLERDDKDPLYEYARAESRHGGIHLIKPVTYVNRSGLAVTAALERLDVDPSELFVIVDDFNLPLGTLRIRTSGSSGGHRGLASIIEELGRADFPRLRAGIGPLPEDARADRDRIPDFVLDRFRADEEDIVDDMMIRAVEAVELVINDRLDLAISRYNANPTPGE